MPATPRSLCRSCRVRNTRSRIGAGSGVPSPELPVDFADDLAPPMPAEIAALRDAAQPVVMFAYGSLIWDPESCTAEAEPALLRGYHRSFCLYSYDYRGTSGRPGLVLGLDRGGSCRGVMLRLAPE